MRILFYCLSIALVIPQTSLAYDEANASANFPQIKIATPTTADGEREDSKIEVQNPEAYSEEELTPSETETKTPCVDLSRDFLADQFSHNISHMSFVEIINERKRIYPKGTELRSILEEDYEFSYYPLEDWIRKTQLKNGLRTQALEEEMLIALPFCQPAKKEDIAIIDEKKNKEKFINENPIADIDFSTKTFFSISSQLGVLSSVNSDNDELTMQLFKIGGKYHYAFAKKYAVSLGVSVSKFLNISYPNTETTGSSSFLPEFNASISKKSGKFILGLGYDMLNYFLSGAESTEIVIEPVQVHRFSFKPAYLISEKVFIFGALGYLTGTGSGEDVNGPDFSLGLGYSFGAKRQYTLAALGYQGLINTENGDETSSVYLMSLGMRL